MWSRILFILTVLTLLLAPATSQDCVQCGGSPWQCYPPEGQGSVFSVYCDNTFTDYLSCCHDDCSWVTDFSCLGWKAGCSIEHHCEGWAEDRWVICYNC